MIVLNKIASTALAALMLVPLMPAHAQEAPVSGRALTIYGNDQCPRDTICIRAPESERYRIPERLRKTENTPERESWADRAASVDGVGATGIGSCSNVGAGGQSGCNLRAIRQARAERKQAQDSGEPLLGYSPVIE